MSDDRPRRTWAHALTGLAILLCWVLAVTLWPSLPERLPTHFDVEGRPDSFTERGVLVWFWLPVFATVFWLLLVGILRWAEGLVRRKPEWVNLPDKEAFLRLDEAARVRAARPMFTLLVYIPAFPALVFAYLIHGSHAVATGRAATLSALPVLPIMAGMVGVIVWAWVVTRRAVRREATGRAQP